MDSILERFIENDIASLINTQNKKKKSDLAITLYGINTSIIICQDYQQMKYRMFFLCGIPSCHYYIEKDFFDGENSELKYIDYSFKLLINQSRPNISFEEVQLSLSKFSCY